MTDLRTIARPQLEKLITRADKEGSEICSALIADGRGHCRHSDLIQMTDELALRYRANSEQIIALRDEAAYRMRYHGNLRPVKAT
jgi:hypothetical protein